MLFYFGCKSQAFSIFCIFIYYPITTFISFALSVIYLSNNAYLIQYHFKLIPFSYKSNIIECFINRNENNFLQCFKLAYDANWFQKRTEFERFNSGFNLGHFFVNFVKMADLGSKDSSDISLLDNNFHLIR